MFPRLHSASRNPSRRRFRREPRTLGRHSGPASGLEPSRPDPPGKVRGAAASSAPGGGSPPWGTRGSPSYRNSRVGRAGRVPRSSDGKRSSGSRRSAGRRDAGLEYPCLHSQRSYFMFFLQTHYVQCYRDARDEFYLFFLACTSAVMHISCIDAYEFMRKFSMFT